MPVRRCDDGFSLTELVVVMSLMGLILSIAYGLFTITRAGTAISNREAWTAREVAAPLDFAERVLSQQIRFDTSDPQGISPWRVAFFTQRGGSSTQQRYVIEVPANAGDHRLLVSMDHGGSTGPVAWSEANFNRLAGVPLFEFRDVNGQVLTADFHQARSIVVTIVTEHEGRRFSDSRTILFRNR